MNKITAVLLSLILVLALSAFGEAPAPITQPTTVPTTVQTTTPTTAPMMAPTTAPTTKPVTEPVTEPAVQRPYPAMPVVAEGSRRLTDGELEEFEAMFRLSAEGNNWYNYALTSIYATPAELDLLAFFYSAPLEELTQADLDFCGETASQIHKYSVSTMIEVLDTYFGIGFYDTNGIGLDQMVYNEEEHCYYHEHGDFRASYHTVFEGYVNPDNTVELYYIDQIASVEENVVQVVTLRYVDQGLGAPCWQVVSNIQNPAE